jgi:hypothetical protein
MADDHYDIFVSYARADRARVDFVWDHLVGQHWRVWRDDFIPSNANFHDEIHARLRAATCVVVVWSAAAAASEWVRAEAAVARETKSLFLVQIDQTALPDDLKEQQAAQLQSWDGGIDSEAFKRLLRDLAERIGPKKPVGTFPRLLAYEIISDKHLALVHTAWRRADKDSEFPGETMYQIHVILLGRAEVLDRVESVIYHLDPSYPQHTYVRSAADRPRNFELKELANGFSVLRASVRIKGQRELVELSRFINLAEVGPRLEQDYIGTRLWYEDE